MVLVLAQAEFGEPVQMALAGWPVGMGLLPVDPQEWVSHHDLPVSNCRDIELP